MPIKNIVAKLPIIKPKEVLRILLKKGFEIDHTTGSHYILYNSNNNKRVVLPFHKKDLPKRTLIAIIKSAGLNRNEL